MAMALDAAAGAVDGVRSLSKAVVKTGATEAEICETLRVAQFISGAGSTFTAGRALSELF